MSDEKVYLDKHGYNELLQSIEDVKKRIQENNLGRKEAFDAGAGDGWDSPEFEEIERQERILIGELNRLKDVLARVQIVERDNDSEVIDIGDIVKVDLYFSPEDYEEEMFKLTGGGAAGALNIKKEIPEISINSPMGASIYKKKVGETTTYKVNDRNFTVVIKSKLDLSKGEDEDDSLTPKR